MPRISSDTPGLHGLREDYQTSGLGKFGNRDVTLNQVQTHLKSSSKPGVFKTLFSRMADVLPGNHGKIRSYNRAQKEFSRELGGVLGRIHRDGKDISAEKLRDSLADLKSLSDKLGGKVHGFDGQAFLKARLDVHFSKLTSQEVKDLAKAIKDLQIDTRSAPQQYTKELESVGLGGAFAEIKGARVQNDLQVLSDMLKAMQGHVLTRNFAVQAKVPESHVVLFQLSGLDMTTTRDVQGKQSDSAEKWGKLNLSRPDLKQFLAAKLTSDDVRRIQTSGFGADDFAEMTGPPLNLSNAVAAECLSHGCNAADIQDLMKSGLSRNDALEFARAGCSLADINELMTARGYSKDEAIAFRRAGWSTDGVITLSELRDSKVVQGSVKDSSGGRINEVSRLKYKVGSQEKEYFFARSTNSTPDSDVWGALNPDHHSADNPKLAQRNIASYKLDQHFKFGLVPETKYATLKAQDGTMMVGTAMARAPGRAAQDVDTKPVTAWQTLPPDSPEIRFLNQELKGDFDAFKQNIKGKGYQAQMDPVTGAVSVRKFDVVPHNVILNHPELRRQLIELQFLDMLSGQLDRSPGNYFIEVLPNGSLKLTAIDNDLSWGTDPGSEAQITNMVTPPKNAALQLVALPPIADQNIKTKFMQMTDQNLKDVCKGLSDAEFQAAKNRLAYIKDHLSKLPSNQIVADWGAGADRVFDRLTDENNCYLMRDARFFKPPEYGNN